MAKSQQIQSAINSVISGLGSADDWRQTYQSFQDRVISRAIELNPTRVSEARFGGTLPMHMLPVREQSEFMAEFRRITGLNDILAKLGSIDSGVSAPAHIQQMLTGSRAGTASNILNNMNVIRGLETDAPFGVLPVLGGAEHPVRQLLAGLNINFDARVRGRRAGLVRESLGSAVAQHHFGPGISSLPLLDTIGPQQVLTPGRRAMVFDIETAGLKGNQIREVSWSGGVLGGAMTEGQVLSRPRLFARGTMGVRDGSDRVVSMGLEDFVNKHHYGGRLASAPTTRVGDDFARQMMPFLEQVTNSDVIIGHNIAKFDIPQVFKQLASTRMYANDEGFRTLVDTAHTAVRSRMLDTLSMAQNATNLAHIPIASELAADQKFTRHSISNILLETNLLELDPSLAAHITGQGLHIGEADAAVTMSLARNMHNLTVQSLGDAGLRGAIVGASAITPLTNVTDISDPVRRHLAAVGVSNTTMNAIEHQALETRNMRFGLNRAATMSMDPNGLLFGNNVFERAAFSDYKNRNPGRIFTDMSRLSPSEFRGVQKELAKRGMPFAGLSMEERAFGTSLSRLTGGIGRSGTSAAARILPFSGDVMHARFANFDAADESFRFLTGGTGRISMPASILEGAGLLNSESPALLTLSRVAPTEVAPHARVNLMYGLDDASRQTLASHLQSVASGSDEQIVAALGLDPEGFDRFENNRIAQNFRDALQDSGETQGILSTLNNPDMNAVAIGQLHPNEAEGVINLLQDFNITDVLSDEKNIGIGVAYGGLEGGAINTYGAVLTGHLGESERAVLGAHVAQAKKVEEAYKAVAQDRGMFTLASHSAEIPSGSAVNKVLEGTYNAFQVVKKHFGVAIAGTAALGIADFMYKRHKRNEFYSQAMTQMSFERGGTSNYNSARVLEAKMASGVNKSYQRYDPLATAFVTSDLDNGKINHTSMAWDKNNTLYGGVL